MTKLQSLVLVVALLLGGCSQVSYYSQAVGGQWGVYSGREAIDTLLDDPETSPELRQKLELVWRIREFASQELGLPDNASYRYYNDLGRRYVVWNVVATPPYDINPKTWCFPVAGCIAYKGYFAEADAEALEASLLAEGYDTYLYGVAAYSTLGKFADPVLNTFLHYNEIGLTRLIFHELAHQVVYVDDDSGFNEAFATAVELAGIELWMQRYHTGREFEEYLAETRRNNELTDWVLEYRIRLAQLYADGPESGIAQQKKEVFDEMKTGYQRITASGNGTRYFDWWFGHDLNNAHLASLATYHRLVPAFSNLLAQAGSFEKFYDMVRELEPVPREERNQRLKAASTTPAT